MQAPTNVPYAVTGRHGEGISMRGLYVYRRAVRYTMWILTSYTDAKVKGRETRSTNHEEDHPYVPRLHRFLLTDEE